MLQVYAFAESISDPGANSSDTSLLSSRRRHLLSSDTTASTSTAAGRDGTTVVEDRGSGNDVPTQPLMPGPGAFGTLRGGRALLQSSGGITVVVTYPPGFGPDDFNYTGATNGVDMYLSIKKTYNVTSKEIPVTDIKVTTQVLRDTDSAW
jgi:hypothetical protein